MILTETYRCGHKVTTRVEKSSDYYRTLERQYGEGFTPEWNYLATECEKCFDRKVKVGTKRGMDTDILRIDRLNNMHLVTVG